MDFDNSFTYPGEYMYTFEHRLYITPQRQHYHGIIYGIYDFSDTVNTLFYFFFIQHFSP